jgi:hypothetical protein
LSSSGGESSYARETINSLFKLGYDIEMITAQKPNFELISKHIEKDYVLKEHK